MASGDTLCRFTPLQNEPPASVPATLAFRNLHPILEFSNTTGQDVAIFSDVLPRNYGGNGITVYIHWCAVPTTGTVGWLIGIERIGTALDIDADSFAANQTATATTVSGTSGTVIITSAAFTHGAQMDSLAVGEAFRLKLTRDIGNDDAAGLAQVLAVEIKET
jgi:hypothetical protein